jgi:hypothetical protein
MAATAAHFFPHGTTTAGGLHPLSHGAPSSTDGLPHGDVAPSTRRPEHATAVAHFYTYGDVEPRSWCHDESSLLGLGLAFWFFFDLHRNPSPLSFYYYPELDPQL